MPEVRLNLLFSVIQSVLDLLLFLFYSFLIFLLSEQFQAPKLIPLQNLIAFEQRRQHISAPCPLVGQEHSEPIQLLKADSESFESRHLRNNKKRQGQIFKICFSFAEMYW